MIFELLKLLRNLRSFLNNLNQFVLIKMEKERMIQKFREEQLKLAKKVVIKDEFEEIKLVGGVDQAFVGNDVISAVVVCDYRTMKVLEKQYAVVKTNVPYIPSYLSYREAPAIIEAVNKLEKKPNVLLVDGHGIAHPRKIGLASHTGLSLDIPTIGIAKALLCGEVKEERIIIGESTRGYQLIAKEHANPLFVSPGHKVGLKNSLEIVKNCIRLPHKLPEPLHLAHRYADKIRKELENKNPRPKPSIFNHKKESGCIE
ncbi:MAG: endonuclease V [Flavobacteriaceae bacterium]|nr:endonuclease V [Flavobacteriaceae bacterium]